MFSLTLVTADEPIDSKGERLPLSAAALSLWCGACDRSVVVQAHLVLLPARAGLPVSIGTCRCGANDWRTRDTRTGKTLDDLLTVQDRKFLGRIRIQP